MNRSETYLDLARAYLAWRDRYDLDTKVDIKRIDESEDDTVKIYFFVAKHANGARVKGRTDDPADAERLRDHYARQGFTVEITTRDVKNPTVRSSLEFRGPDADAELRMLREGKSNDDR